MNKYPRTLHLPFSPEIHSDDKTINIDTLNELLSHQIVITEKMDGGNCMMQKGVGVFARSHSLPTSCPTFNLIKNIHFFPKEYLMNDNYLYFGENLYAVHSIKYENLEDTFFLFKIYDKEKKLWLSYTDVVEEAQRLNFKMPNIIKSGFFTFKELQIFLDSDIKTRNNFEGYVINNMDSFGKDEFSNNVVKYVRLGHVQTDEHWSKNWVKSNINI
jgi:hypothetical protein